MKKVSSILRVLFCLFLPVASVYAQQKQDDSKYLAGAVPEVNGKVVFSQTYNVADMSQEAIYTRMLAWMDERLGKNENTSRIVYRNPEQGEIVGMGDEWIVFQSTVLSLDRTRILYYLSAVCAPGKCTVKIERISFIYREGAEKYTAEEWVTDKYALNKAKTKLMRGLAKWRRKTVDFADDMFRSAATALSVAPVQQKAEETTAQLAPAAATLKEVSPDALSPDLIRMGAGKIVIAIGKDAFNMTTFTANAGGSLGKVSGKAVIFTLLAPDQSYEEMERADIYTVRFYPTDSTSPAVVLECRKLPAQAPLEGQPRMYIGEIVKAFTR
ncbi:MAG: DUF4468 domain-containing protein [Prevotellaceae bacterium]|jgi:hypothetical protein|nr:DUF4468 domain-containing protein [Prevotellaceae bacterium]